MYDITLLHTAMQERGWSVFELAAKCGKNEATIRQLFKRGSGRPGTVKLIAKTLGVPMKKIVIPEPRRKSA